MLRAAELAAMARDVLSRSALGLPETELICEFDAAGMLEGRRPRQQGRCDAPRMRLRLPS